MSESHLIDESPETKLPGAIIGVTGCKFHGKDTIADFLVSEYGYIKLTLAKPLKDSCQLLFGLSHEQCYGSKKEEVDERWGASPREILQFVGTDLFRKELGKRFTKIGGDFWVKCLIEQIKWMPRESKIVISDVRFPNEVKAIKELSNSRIFRVVRPLELVDLHESELGISSLEVDATLTNDSTLDALYTKVRQLLDGN